MRPSLRLAPTLLLIASLGALPLVAADQTGDPLWTAAAAAAQAPTGWTWSKSDPAGKLTFSDEELVLQGETGGWSLVERPLAAQDGSDETPLAISCAIGVSGTRPVAFLPAVLVVRWGPKDLVAIGLSDDPEHRGDTASFWSGWSLGGVRGQARPDLDAYQKGGLNQVRVLLLSKVVLLQASRDGFDWRTLRTLPRDGACRNAPSALTLGHGWLRAGQDDGNLQDDSKVAKPAAAKKETKKERKEEKREKEAVVAEAQWRFSHLRVARVSSDLPSELLRAYQRKESGDDTRDALTAATYPAAWRIAGPFSEAQDPFVANPAAEPAWQTVQNQGNASDRLLQLDDLLPGGGKAALRYAEFTITCDQPRLERFLFDGLRDVSLTVNGRLIANTRSVDDRQIVPDRLGVVAWLQAGDNIVRARVAANLTKGDARLILRHEPGDPRYRAALTKRLLGDFPPEAAIQVSDRMDIARAWEAAGNLVMAATAYGDAAAVEEAPSEPVAAALTARVRLHALLHDDAAQAADIAALAKLWASDGTDAVSAALRGARLQTILGRDDLAAATIEQAVKQATSIDDKVTLTGERLRLRRALGQERELADDAKVLAASLPAGDPRIVQLQLLAARTLNRLAVASAAQGAPAPVPDLTATIAAAQASKRPADLRLALLACQAAGALDQQHAVAQALIAACGDGDPLLITGAELVGNDAQASAALKRFIGANAAAALPELRQQVLRTLLADSADGRALLAAVAQIKIDPKSLANASPDQRTWKACGPLANDGWKRYTTPPVDPAKPDTAKEIDGKAWKDVTSDGRGIIDLTGQGVSGDNAVAILTCELNSESERDTVLSFGADDGVVVWCNGAKLYEDQVQRGLQPDSLQVTLHLKAGVNRLTAMVQNGTAGSAFQARLRESPYPATQLARLLALSSKQANAESREAFAQAFQSLAIDVVASCRPEAPAIALAALAAFPDQPARNVDLANTLVGVCDRRPGAPAAALPTVLAWLDQERIAGFNAGYPDYWRDMIGWTAQRLRLNGEYQLGLELLRDQLLTEPAPALQAAIQTQQAAMQLAAGALHPALALFNRVIDDPALSANDERWARERQALARKVRGDLVRLDPAFEAANAARALLRLVTANDAEAVVAAAQKILENQGNQLVAGTDGRVVPAGRLATTALSSGGAAFAEAYRGKFQSRAESALRSAAAAQDPVLCERVAARFPLCTTRGPALLRAAELYRDRGDLALARATAQLAIGALEDATLQARAKALAAVPVPLPSGAGVPTLPVLNLSYPVAAGDAADLVRVANRHGALTPAFAGGLLVAHDADGAWGFDPLTSIVRWRIPGAGAAASPFAGLPTWTTGSNGALAAVRLRLPGGRFAVAVIDPLNGRTQWSSGASQELLGAGAVGSPCLVGNRLYAAFGEGDGARRLVAFAADDGRIIWSTALPGSCQHQPAIGDATLDLAGHTAAPTVAGRDLLWCNDAGLVVCLDAGSGALSWVAPYPRSVIDPGEGLPAIEDLAGRGASRVVVAGERVIVAPRDSVGLVAFDRASGATAWSRPITAIRELAGLTIAAKPLVLAQGARLEALDPQDGTLAWSVDHALTRGTALSESGAVFASTDEGVLRLDPASGKRLAQIPWNAGQSGGTLVRAGRSILAVGDGVISTVGQPSAKPVVIPAGDGGAFVATGLATQEDGQALGLGWHWAAGNVLGIMTPPQGGERYVRTANSLARIEGGAAPRLVWSTPIDGDAQTWGVTRDAVIGVANNVATWYDRATGARRATVPVSGVQGLLFGGDYGMTARFADDGMTVFHPGWGGVDVYDPANGERRSRFDMGRGVATAVLRGTRLLTVRDSEGGACIDDRDAAGGGTDNKVLLLPNKAWWDQTVLPLDRDRWLFGHHGKTWLIDLPSASLKELPSKFDWSQSRTAKAFADGSRFVAYREDWGKGYVVQYDGEGKLITAQETVRIPPLSTDGKLTLLQLKDDQLAVVALDQAGGERWRWSLGRHWERKPRAMLALGNRTVVLAQQVGNGGLHWYLLGNDGKLQGDGALPGSNEENLTATMIDGRLWLGTATGLAILAPCKPEARTVLPTGNDVAQPLRAIRDLAVTLTERATSPVAAASAVSIDDQLEQWPAALLKSEAGDHRVPLQAGQARLGEVALRGAWDADALKFEVTVGEPSGAPLTLRLAVDAVMEGKDSIAAPVLELRNQDGRTLVSLVGGDWSKGADAGELTPQARAVRTLDGWRFAVSIPWPIIRPDPAQRPGGKPQVRVALLASVPGDAVEFGHGLSRGLDRSLMPVLTLEKPKK